MLFLILISAMLLCLSTVSAQQPTIPLPPVIVKGVPLPSGAIPDRLRTEEQARQEIERIPGGAEVVGSKEIEESRGANLKDALDFVPGVLVRPRFGAADESQLSIRGSGLRNNFHLRGINVLIDGFLYGNADGFSDFESLELLSTKYIEVFKGSNALRFGANSMGGAINLVTKTGYDAGLIELRSEAGSYDFFKNYIASGHVLGPFDYYVGFADTQLTGYREHSEQSRDRVYSTFGYQLPGGTTMRLDFTYVRNEENLPGSLTLPEFKSNPRQRNPAAAFADEARNYDYLRGAFTVRTPLSDVRDLEWALQYNYQDMDHPLSFAIDEIRNVNIRPFPGAPFTIPRFENIGRSRHAGVEVGTNVLLFSDIATRMGLGVGGDTLGWRTTYTWSRFIYVNDPTFGNNDIPGFPENYIRSELRYDHPIGLWLAPNIEWVPNSYPVNSANTARTEAYFLFNIGAGYTYKPWNLSTFFLAQNLTNQSYISAVTVDDPNGRFFLPGDGRAFYGGINWRRR
jgi:outer membrane receptor protein involved in Fe transport